MAGPIDVSVVRADGVFEIIDLDAHPDRLPLFRAGKFEEGRSARAGAGPVDAPLLLYWRQEATKALFVPAPQTSKERDDADRERLVSLLIERLGESRALPEELGLAVVSPPSLPPFLAEAEKIRALAPPLHALLMAEEGEALSRLIAEAPQLLGDEAQQALELLKTAPPDGAAADDWRGFLANRSELLHRLRSGPEAKSVSPELRSLAQALAGSFSRFEASQRLEHLEATMSAAQALLAAPQLPAAPAELQAELLHQAARAFLARFARLGESADLAQARMLLERAGGLVRDDPARRRAGLLDSLAKLPL